MTALWYWLAFALAAIIVLAAVPLIAAWEDRQDDRDRETWSEISGSTR